jgi:hypothetical protein
MKLSWKCAAVAAGLLCASVAHAQTEGLYAGVTLSQVTYKEDGFPSAKPLTIGGKFGKQFTPNLALEARLGFGISDDEVDAGGIPVKVELDNYFGVYGKGILPLSQNFSLYGLLGFTRAELTASAFGFSSSDSDDDISYGIGAEFGISRSASISLEWARLLEGEGFKIEGLTLGVSFWF